MREYAKPQWSFPILKFSLSLSRKLHFLLTSFFMFEVQNTFLKIDWLEAEPWSCSGSIQWSTYVFLFDSCIRRRKDQMVANWNQNKESITIKETIQMKLLTGSFRIAFHKAKEHSSTKANRSNTETLTATIMKCHNGCADWVSLYPSSYTSVNIASHFRCKRNHPQLDYSRKVGLTSKMVAGRQR